MEVRVEGIFILMVNNPAPRERQRKVTQQKNLCRSQC